MPQPRRRLVRTPPASPTPDLRTQEQLRRLRERLTRKQAAQAHWLTRLRAAYHQIESLQQQIAHLEQAITHLEGS